MTGLESEAYPASKYAISILATWLIPHLYMDWNRSLLQWIRQEQQRQGLLIERNGGGEINVAFISEGISKIQWTAWSTILFSVSITVLGSYLVHRYTNGMDERMLLILAGLSRLVAAFVFLSLTFEIPVWLGIYRRPTRKISLSNSQGVNDVADANETNSKSGEDNEDEQEETADNEEASRDPSSGHDHPPHVTSRQSQEEMIIDIPRSSVLVNTRQSTMFPVSELRMASDSPEDALEGGHDSHVTSQNNHWMSSVRFLESNRHEDEAFQVVSTYYSIKRLRFELFWAITGQFSRILLLTWLFSCGDPVGANWAGALPFSWLFGLFWGFVLTFGIYFGRTRLPPKARVRTTFATVLLLLIFCLAGIYFACEYVQEVWNPAETGRDYITALLMLAVLLGAMFCHYGAYKQGTKWASAAFTETTVGGSTDGSSPTSFDGTQMGASFYRDSTFFDSALFSPRRKNTTDELPSAGETNEAKRTPTPRTMESDNSRNNRGASIVEDDFQEGTTYKAMCWAKSCGKCCQCCRRRDATYLTSPIKPRNRVYTIGRSLLSFAVQGICFFLIAVNIGATQQGNYAKEKFPSVQLALYEGQENGPVCAYAEPFNDDLTMTFENMEAALAANYTLAHCGACASCSSWQNLRLQWTTRRNLAKKSHKCAKVKLFKGWDASMDCHLETIGFDEACSECWVEVEGCATKHCAFIAVQSNIINRIGNFEVGPEIVTAAMCEEAICEVDFVPCSGANRRRMNIVSDIARPNKQQCTLIPESNSKWLELFGPEDPEE